MKYESFREENIRQLLKATAKKAEYLYELNIIDRKLDGIASATMTEEEFDLSIGEVKKLKQQSALVLENFYFWSKKDLELWSKCFDTDYSKLS